MNGPDRDLRTRFAARALDFAETFNAGLGGLRIPPGDYTAELTSPEGPSTGGGIQALQHVRLVPAKAGYAPLLVGHANQRGGNAELRSFEYIDQQHRERFKRPVPLDRGQYEEFLQMTRNFFEVNQLNVVLVGAQARTMKPPSATSTSPPSSIGIMVAAVAASLFVVTVVLWSIVRHGDEKEKPIESSPSAVVPP